jgi:soluble lytic murein transglycosylase-like protein
MWWKAQLYQESRLDPTAESPVGARGLAQFMPGTWGDVSKALKWGIVSRDDACLSAKAGAYYMARLQQIWKSPRPQMERHFLAQASYNAGAGHIINAQRLCGGARDWRDISKCLPQITGRHSRETITYVDRIARWRQRMRMLR